MRAALCLSLLLLGAACRAEPSFDARYNEAAERVENRAAAMQAELDQRLAASDAAGQNAGAPPADAAPPTR